MKLDVVIRNGRVFDGTGGPSSVRNVGIAGGRIVEISDLPLAAPAAEVIDAAGKWVMPGFLDCHTHYDAELIASPALLESLRHGVTTVTVGSCSISAVLASADDCSDMFTRVESVPREHVLPLLRQRKTWSTPQEFVTHLQSHPLGPNVTSFLGHSDMRAEVMGLARAVDPDARPTTAEMKRMETHLHDALDAGFLGLSTMTNPWDKLDGERFRSARLPSTYATWSEYRRLHSILRERGRVLQSAPNLVTTYNALLFMIASASFAVRKALKTTLITLADPKASPWLYHLTTGFTAVFRRLFGSDLRWQTLPVPFELYADGIDLVVFEEFGAGQAALHLADELERNTLLKDAAYRRRFRRDYSKRYSPRVWHRDLADAFVVACPELDLVGKSFGQIATERGNHVVDQFLDLVVAHGRQLRWHTVIANHRPAMRARMMRSPEALIGFADSGAHIRNMAFYNAPLRVLRAVRDADLHDQPIMSIEKAVHRLTGEIADWFDIDAGHLRIGDRADVVVVNPEALDARLDAYHEDKMDGFGPLMRMVNRSEGTVAAVIVNGRVAARDGIFARDLGERSGYGCFLAAGQGQRGNKGAHPDSAALRDAAE